MSLTRRVVLNQAVVLFVSVVAFILLGCSGDAAWIRGISSNFDLHNFTGNPVNDLAVTLESSPIVGASGTISPADIVRLYAGHASRGWTPQLVETERGIVIIWKAPDGTYLEPCEWLHLGISLRAGTPPILYARATWTLDGQPVGTVAFVWQNWVGYADSSVGDIIIPPMEFPTQPGTQEPDALIVSRSWATSGSVIPLDNLTQDDPLVIQLNWPPRPPQVDVLTPDSEPSEVLIGPTPEEIQAIVVQYTVALESTQQVEAVFTNQARIVHDSSPKPRLLKPVDNLGERPDMIYGFVNLWATEETGLWDDEIVLTQFDLSTDGGQTWEPIGQDDDGTVPTFSTTDETYQHNWWNVKWDTAQYPEGSYLVKAAMTDRSQNTGEDIIELYIDPTPPIPTLEGLHDHQYFPWETTISCNSLDDDIVSVLWEVQLKLVNYTKGIPLLDQHNYGVGQTNNGNMYCAPTASVACLKWWAAHGYSSLTQCLEGMPLTDTQFVEGLADAMGTSSVGGTSGPGIVNGLRKWINDRHLALTVTDHATINPTTIRNELENCKEDVILGVLWNDGGGHIVTVNSIANYTNADGTTNIGVMDPWDGVIVNVKMEPDGDIQWPGKAGVQAAGLLVTVSPTKPRTPWIPIGRDWSILFDPMTLEPGLYFLKATTTDSEGNQGSAQIVARVRQPLLPAILTDVSITRDGAMSFAWEETDFDLKYAYVVEYTDDLGSGVWNPLPGKWPIPELFWTGDSILNLDHRYYRVMKDYEPK
ncbi:MAG: hypothetical protein Q8Q12_02375 [bacterium]|nr:hypothetical protein [bacterium]